jgi:Effector-associated domain 1/TIR domain
MSGYVILRPRRSLVKLTHHQQRQLSEALRDAYTKPRLAQMLWFRLGKQLEDITLGEDFEQVVFQLVLRADSEGWAGELVLAARASNPGNIALREFAEQAGEASPIPPRQDAERVVTGADGGAGPDSGPGWRWEVALSFAGAQRAYVEQVAAALRARGLRCFYDAEEEIELWGKYLAEELPAIYGEQAATVVVFVSAEYAARDWTRLERRAALDRAVRERREYVLPARFDDTALPGLLSAMHAVDLRGRTPQQFAAMIADKLDRLSIAAPANSAAGQAELAGRSNRAGQLDQWIADRRSYYLPLQEAARDLEKRLADLARIYRHESQDPGFTPESLSADFRELYLLSPDPIAALYHPGTDPNQPRRDDHAVQRLRTRMGRELNFATSTVYLAARFLARAQMNRRLLKEGRTSLPAQPARQLRDRLAAVSEAWQGRAGLPTEQQESIGEMMLTPDDRVITQFAFRQRLLEVPGWEQYTALLTFFITEDDDTEARRVAARFDAKVDHEVLATVTALCTLIASLDQITGLADPPDPDWEIELRPCPRPWTPRLTCPARALRKHRSGRAAKISGRG